MGVTPTRGGPIPRYILSTYTVIEKRGKVSFSSHQRASKCDSIADEYIPLDAIGLDGLSDNIEASCVGAVGGRLQTSLGEIEGVSDKHGADTTETTGEEGLDGRGGLLLLLELLVLDGCCGLIVSHCGYVMLCG